MVRSRSQFDTALEVYDEIRRPRAQTVVRQSAEVGMAYYLIDPKFGDDLNKITEEANHRLPLLWWHDIEADVKRAEESFRAKVGESKKSSNVAISVVETTPLPFSVGQTITV
jgi:salicylate hydroxylase